MKDFVKNPLPKSIPQSLIDKLEKVETATVGHFLHSVFVDRDITAIDSTKRVAGTAVTLRLAANDSTLLHDVISTLRPTDILLIDRSGDTKHACWGGVITNAAAICGFKAGIVDGPVTDVNEIRRNQFPMWSRGRSSVTTKLYAQSGAFNIPISIGGVTVKPGDAVLADESGVIILDPTEANTIADKALAMQKMELDLIARLEAGEPLGTITGASKMVEERLLE
ncbi:RraA family protein [Halomonas alkaliantarctica]|uniref:Putative 4-hydroxy-4-methyl-2-oxoglutarate aldolase n=1 Tax=Halomonas alkaliantarctica TaxID=232346 RepID=A0ABY8LN97_9GAMM|nr:RraA family protein [Halomonas alkaliantarctica]WGI24819.1 RraA family protein [Halomonas alkaliantarctica]